KGDVLVQVWVDSRVLATLCRWMDAKGEYAMHMSQAVRRPLEVLAEFLADQGEVEMVDDTAEARSLLSRRFNVDLNRGGRGTKNVMHNLALSDMRGELGERIQSRRRVDEVNRPGKVRELDPKAAAAIEAYKKMFGDGGEGGGESPEPIVERAVDNTPVVRSVELSEEHTAKMRELEEARIRRVSKTAIGNSDNDISKRFEDIARRDREEQEELDRFIMKRTPNVKEGEDNGSA
ncbi:MAG: hypothetical protein KKF27_21640, partial [Gammaproteobacteria bacterium]|nr:hypothetical protein [Gammaproteobacteria bacterium]